MTKEPQKEDEKERDEVLKRMLNTPPKPREKEKDEIGKKKPAK